MGPILAILRGVMPEHISGVAQVLLEEGIHDVEVSLSEETTGLKCIEKLARDFGDSLNLGVGTVTNTRQVDLAIGAGAHYIIMPGWDREIVRYIQGKSIQVTPGVFTPSEIMQALNEGVELLKLFPAGSLGTGYIKSLFGPFPNLKLMAVGGVTLENGQSFLKAGCVSLGIGSELVPRRATEKENDKIRLNARAFTRLVEQTKTGVLA
jgi:2-dehydro-3-deoxyphosphogluconate aldolase/(4S)-4-hydroxy-2-oxoglutarate aldolase